MRKKDKKEEVHNLFILVHSLSLEKLLRLSNPKLELDFYNAYRILTSNRFETNLEHTFVGLRPS